MCTVFQKEDKKRFHNSNHTINGSPCVPLLLMYSYEQTFISNSKQNRSIKKNVYRKIAKRIIVFSEFISC